MTRPTASNPDPEAAAAAPPQPQRYVVLQPVGSSRRGEPRPWRKDEIVTAEDLLPMYPDDEDRAPHLQRLLDLGAIKRVGDPDPAGPADVPKGLGTQRVI
jgi:hypothetical protein